MVVLGYMSIRRFSHLITCKNKCKKYEMLCSFLIPTLLSELIYNHNLELISFREPTCISRYFNPLQHDSTDLSDKILVA